MGSPLFLSDLLTGHELRVRSPGFSRRCAVGRAEARTTNRRFMGSPLFLSDLLTGHELRVRSPGFSRRCAVRRAEARTTNRRFMGSPLFLSDLLTGHELRVRSPGFSRRCAVRRAEARTTNRRFMGSFHVQLLTRIGAMNPGAPASLPARRSASNSPAGMPALPGRFMGRTRQVFPNTIPALGRNSLLRAMRPAACRHFPRNFTVIHPWHRRC